MNQTLDASLREENSRLALTGLYYPSCGTPTRLDRVDNPMAGKFKAEQVVSRSICGNMYQ
jgi:hypothetical protein